MSLAAEARATGQNAVKCSKLAVVSVNYPKFVLLDCKCCCHNLLILNDTVTIKHDDICSAPVFTMLELLMRNPNKLLNDCSLLPSKINNRKLIQSHSFIHLESNIQLSEPLSLLHLFYMYCSAGPVVKTLC